MKKEEILKAGYDKMCSDNPEINYDDFDLQKIEVKMILQAIELYAQQVAKEAAAYAWDAAMRYINDDSDFPMGEGKKKYPSKTEYINQKFPTNPNK